MPQMLALTMAAVGADPLFLEGAEDCALCQNRESKVLPHPVSDRMGAQTFRPTQA